MKEKTPFGIIIVAITFATTIAVTPTLIQIQSTQGSVISSTSRNAMAAPNGSTTMTCVHNGNGADKCTGGSSSTTVTCTKVQGKYVCSSS